MELKTPFRIYWDLPAGDAAGLGQIAGQIVAMRILSLDLTVARHAVPGWPGLLDLFSQVPMAISVTVPLADFSPALAETLRHAPVKNLYLAIDAAADLVAIASDLPRGAGLPAPGVSIAVNRENYLQLPDIYHFCAIHGFSIALPMQRLSAGGSWFALEREERENLALCLKGVRKPEALQVSVHDPFLWRAFFPDLDFPEGRCQAANTMLYISAHGDVLPCPSLPLVLGNLKETTLAAIVRSGEKRALREKLLKTPAGCDGCARLDGCFGGCRGRGYVACGSWDGPDPGCS